MKTLSFIFLTMIISNSTFAERSFICAEDTNGFRDVVRAVSEYTMTLSKFNGFQKTYNDVRFKIVEENVFNNMLSFESDTQNPDGDQVTVGLKVYTNHKGNRETARWLAIEFFPVDETSSFLGEIYINQKEPVKATCLEL